MLEKLRFGKEKSLAVKVKIPKHVAITLDGIDEWKRKNEKYKEEANKKSFLKVIEIIKYQIKLDIPIITFSILNEGREYDNEFLEELSRFITYLIDEETMSKLKISVLGKWYDLPNKVLEPMKKLIEKTKDNESFFVNLCINYNGQEEIVDACRLIARKIMAEKIDPESIDKETIKENSYSSYFIPPELIIVNGNKNLKSNLLLWDSASSSIYFSNKMWPDFEKSDFMDAINAYQKSQ